MITEAGYNRSHKLERASLAQKLILFAMFFVALSPLLIGFFWVKPEIIKQKHGSSNRDPERWKEVTDEFLIELATHLSYWVAIWMNLLLIPTCLTKHRKPVLFELYKMLLPASIHSNLLITLLFWYLLGISESVKHLNNQIIKCASMIQSSLIHGINFILVLSLMLFDHSKVKLKPLVNLLNQQRITHSHKASFCLLKLCCQSQRSEVKLIGCKKNALYLQLDILMPLLIIFMGYTFTTAIYSLTTKKAVYPPPPNSQTKGILNYREDLINTILFLSIGLATMTVISLLLAPMINLLTFILSSVRKWVNVRLTHNHNSILSHPNIKHHQHTETSNDTKKNINKRLNHDPDLHKNGLNDRDDSSYLMYSSSQKTHY